MTLSQAVPDVVGEIADSIELAPRINGFHLEPRCRVCRNDTLRRKVNQMLAMGAPYAGIVRALAADNAELDDRNRITLDSIRTHTTKHFPVQSVAKDAVLSAGVRGATWGPSPFWPAADCRGDPVQPGYLPAVLPT